MKKLLFIAILALAAACGKDDPTEPKLEVTPAPEGSMILDGITWASVNVDDYQTFAAKPDMHTKHYQWNRSKAWGVDTITFDDWLITGGDSATFWILANDDGYIISDYPKDSESWLDTAITDATWTINPCPRGWRLPTMAEYEALDEAGNTWAEANARGNAVAGRFYGANHAICSLPDSMVDCIFMPANGQRFYFNGGLFNQSDGYYWSSNEYNSTIGHVLFFNINRSNSENSGYRKAYGFNVRCVAQ